MGFGCKGQGALQAHDGAGYRVSAFCGIRFRVGCKRISECRALWECRIVGLKGLAG